MRCLTVVALAIALIGSTRGLCGQESATVVGPAEQVFASPGGVPLKAYVFAPAARKAGERRAAVVVFHGGGWADGEPAWAFARARHFASLGLIGIAAQYRLSDQKTVTPIEAMADARAVIGWMRARAGELGIDPDRIAADGWSAGAHLAASAAIFSNAAATQTSTAPNALILVSPAVSLDADSWFQRLVGARGNVRDFSPDEHVRAGLPPTIILQGAQDTVTPLAGVRRFCDRMKTAGNTCELHVYDGFGHLFTPAGIPDNGEPKPDAATRADALAKAEGFLRTLGYIQ